MLSVNEARQRLLDALPIVESESVALDHANGRVLAEDINANADSPRFDNSSMDGFALRAGDVSEVRSGKPVVLAVIGDQPAGSAFSGTVAANQAVRIMTGAAMPAGADAVVPVEDTDAPVAEVGARLPAQVQVRRTLKPGDFVRPAGLDFRAGDVLLTAGRRLQAQDLGLIAMLGLATVKVHRRPRVAILSSGDELLKPGDPVQPGKIYETNSHMLASLVQSCGAEPVLLGIARDQFADVKAHLDRAVDAGVDLILTSAGVSVGAYDYLRDAVLSDGALDFWKVNMRPGKPFAFGRYREIAYIGLPGNPVSSFVGFEVFVRPALQKIVGAKLWARRKLTGRLAQDISSDGRESYLRVQIQDSGTPPSIVLTGHQGSGNLFSLVEAQALIVVPAGVEALPAGSTVEVWPL